MRRNTGERDSRHDFLIQKQVGSLEEARLRIVEHIGGSQSFHELVSRGCAADILLCLVANAILEAPPLDAWKNRFGIERRKIPSAIQRMRATAKDLEPLEQMTWPKFKDRFDPSGFRDYVRSLPGSLRSFADAVERISRTPAYMQRASTFANTALAQLVAYVSHCTGSPHDRQVSTLLGAVRRDEYGPDDLKTWRTDHRQLLSHSAQMYPSLFRK